MTEKPQDTPALAPILQRLDELERSINDIKGMITVQSDEATETLDALKNDLLGKLATIEAFEKNILQVNQHRLYAELLIVKQAAGVKLTAKEQVIIEG